MQSETLPLYIIQPYPSEFPGRVLTTSRLTTLQVFIKRALALHLPRTEIPRAYVLDIRCPDFPLRRIY
jgi:hypothetical protein